MGSRFKETAWRMISASRTERMRMVVIVGGCLGAMMEEGLVG